MRGMDFWKRLAWAPFAAWVWISVANSDPKAEPAAATTDSSAATAEQDHPGSADIDAAQKALCGLIETAAADNGLPVGFFTRLIWKESRFRSEAVSPVGAQGIAQFMPGTAAERGLEDPFDITTAIPASARFLSDLKIRFGNLGLAAAAYNAGPQRVSDWLEEVGTLPFETQNYVLSITGLPAATWADQTSKAEQPAEIASAKDCLALAALLREKGAPVAAQIETATAPWGVQVAGAYSRSLAVNAYAQMKVR